MRAVEDTFLNVVDLRGSILDGANFGHASLLPIYGDPEQFRNSVGLDTASVGMHSGELED